MNDQTSPQSKGGIARSERLSPQDRKRIASEAAVARWADNEKLPKVEFSGVLEIGDFSIPCAVLSDGARVLSESGIATAILGGRSGASKRKKKAAEEAGAQLPIFVAPSQLEPFITNELREGPLKAIRYREGNSIVIGYDAKILRAVCEIWLAARAAGALQTQQRDKAQRAEILIRALADIGIVSLVDEVTGFQKFRARDELQRILSAYIAPEFLPWAKRFPDSFYENLHRVRGWKYEPGHHGRTAYIGKLTNELIYQQLPDGVLEELRKKNPRDSETKRRRRTHHELLTPDVGHPHLDKQILVVTTLLTISDSWDEFRRLFEKRFPPVQGSFLLQPPPSDDE